MTITSVEFRYTQGRIPKCPRCRQVFCEGDSAVRLSFTPHTNFYFHVRCAAELSDDLRKEIEMMYQRGVGKIR